MAVRVLFEKAGDVYVPLFEPDPERTGETLAIPADRDVGAPRPKAKKEKFEERVRADWGRPIACGPAADGRPA